jgi:hypothetical protein
MESKPLPCLAGLRVVECNLSHYRSKGYTDLPLTQRVTDVFQVLIEILQPKLVVAFGSRARSYLNPRQRISASLFHESYAGFRYRFFSATTSSWVALPFGEAAATRD